MIKPDWRCLLGIHKWEKATYGPASVRLCRRCERTDEHFVSNYRCGWDTLNEGQVGAWRKYQEKLRYDRLSPELKAILGKVRVQSIERSTSTPYWKVSSDGPLSDKK